MMFQGQNAFWSLSLESELKWKKSTKMSMMENMGTFQFQEDWAKTIYISNYTYFSCGGSNSIKHGNIYHNILFSKKAFLINSNSGKVQKLNDMQIER